MNAAHGLYPSNRFSNFVPKMYPERTMPLQMAMMTAAIAFKIVGQTIGVPAEYQAELVL